MVAVKLIPRGAPAWKLDMAKREFSILAQLGPGHVNVVRPLEIVLTSKFLALITEFVPGGCAAACDAAGKPTPGLSTSSYMKLSACLVS